MSPFVSIAASRKLIASFVKCAFTVFISLLAIRAFAQIHGVTGRVSGSARMALKQAPGTPTADFFVALEGNDSWSGTLPSRNSQHTDGPFASIARAQIAVQQLLQNRPQR